MTYPTPGNMRALDWQNYVVAQLSQAALGLIPCHAVAMGVEPHADGIVVHFQLVEIDARDIEDMDDIVGEGDVVDIRIVSALRPRPLLSPRDGVRWVYRARTEDDGPTTET
jgi:hypothetical protein